MATGTVKWFNSQKGYGFIQPENGGADVFVHISAVERAGMDNLHEGQKVSYELEQGQRGRVSAVNNIFIGTSNEFGALESGLTAALFGPVISVVAGGIGTILAVIGSAVKWPEIRKIGALDRTLR